MLITLEQAKNHLRLDEDLTEFDDDLILKIETAEELCLQYLNKNKEDYFNEEQQKYIIPNYLKSAILIWTAILFENRAHDTELISSKGDIPREIEAILYMFRTASIS